MKPTSFFVALFAVLLLWGCHKKETIVTHLSQLNGGKTFAVPTGTVADQFVLEHFPDAKLVYFNTILDCGLAVKDGKADAAAYDKPILKNIASKYDGLTVLSEMLFDDNYGFAVQLENIELKKAFDEVLAELKSNGTYDDMMKRWFPDKGDPAPMPEIELEGTNGTLVFGTTAVNEPMAFVNHERKIVGFDVEMAFYVAQKLGKKLEVVDMEFGGLLPSLITGKVDMIGSAISITEERAKRVLFTDCYYQSGFAVLVRNKPFNLEKAKNTAGEVDLDHKKLGVLMGSIYDQYATKMYPAAKIFQYQTVPDMLTAINTKKIDAAFFEDACLSEVLSTNSKIGVLKRNLFTVPIGAGFHRDNSTLREMYNEFLKVIRSNGVYDDIYNRWMVNGLKELPEIIIDQPDGSLIVGLSCDLGFPYVGLKDGQIIGFEIELSKRFAAYLNKELIVSDMPFGSLIAALSTQKIDLIHSSMMITEERKKQVDFSDPYFETGGSIIMLKENLPQRPMFVTIDDIADKRIGIYTGTVHDAFLQQNYPNAKRLLFDFPSDLILALKMDKVDAVMLDYISASVMIKHNPDLVIFNNDIFNTPLGVGFSKKNPGLRDEFNQLLNEIRENKVYDEMVQRWFVEEAEQAVMPEISPRTGGKKLTAGVAVADLPYVAYMNGEYVGFDIEMIKRFAQSRNYQLEILTLEFSSLVAALAAGKVDLIADGISISEERAKMIDFSDPYADFRTAVVVAKKNVAGYDTGETSIEKKPFFESLANSFHNNLIREKRYLLIVSGLKVTFIISIFSALLGTLLGGLICFMRMSKSKPIKTFAGLFIDLIRGTPVLVLLMIIFYVIFASVNINPVFVAVVAFGINFGAYVSEMFRTSIESIDRGQREAGIASGFTKVQTFLHIIMPQATQRVLPVYKGEFISLVKMTSIVGYIAVQDLTKASDIIRSRTFDAFFPLIMAAILYIIIAGLLTWGLSYIEISVDPKRRRIKKTMEGSL